MTPISCLNAPVEVCTLNQHTAELLKEKLRLKGEGRVANWSRGARTVDISECKIDRRKALTNRDIKRLGIENFEKVIGECVKGTDDVVEVGCIGTVSVIPITLDLERFSVILSEILLFSFFEEAMGERNMAVKGWRHRERTHACEAVR